jgi:hypothetical protein
MSSYKIDTVVVRGGQAGLAISYYFVREGREHVVLERAPAVANAWRNQRWDSFTLVTPNFQVRMPRAEYSGKRSIRVNAPIAVKYFDDYSERSALSSLTGRFPRCRQQELTWNSCARTAMRKPNHRNFSPVALLSRRSIRSLHSRTCSLNDSMPASNGSRAACSSGLSNPRDARGQPLSSGAPACARSRNRFPPPVQGWCPSRRILATAVHLC